MGVTPDELLKSPERQAAHFNFQTSSTKVRLNLRQIVTGDSNLRNWNDGD